MVGSSRRGHPWFISGRFIKSRFVQITVHSRGSRVNELCIPDKRACQVHDICLPMSMPNGRPAQQFSMHFGFRGCNPHCQLGFATICRHQHSALTDYWSTPDISCAPITSRRNGLINCSHNGPRDSSRNGPLENLRDGPVYNGSVRNEPLTRS